MFVDNLEKLFIKPKVPVLSAKLAIPPYIIELKDFFSWLKFNKSVWSCIWLSISSLSTVPTALAKATFNLFMLPWASFCPISNSDILPPASIVKNIPVAVLVKDLDACALAAPDSIAPVLIFTIPPAALDKLPPPIVPKATNIEGELFTSISPMYCIVLELSDAFRFAGKYFSLLFANRWL